MESTFSQLYQVHSKQVFNLALQYTQNREDAEEITQDVFLKVHEKLHTHRKEASLKTWIYRITINTALDFLKARKAKKRWLVFSSLFGADLDFQNEPKHFDHPGVLLEQKESIELVFKCLNQLAASQKTVLILLKIDQNSQKETAEIMNISPKAVESLYQRAKISLNKLFQNYEGK